MHNRGIVLRVVVVAAAIAALAGCSSLGTATSNGIVGTAAGSAIGREALGTPTTIAIGQCSKVSYDEFLQEPEGPSGTTVACSSAHQSVTFEVTSLDAAVQRVNAPQLALQACGAYFTDAFPNENHASRLLLSQTLPSITQWAQGNRTVGCQIQETADGSPFRHPTFLNLPDIMILEQAARTSPDVFALCVDDPGTTGTSGPALRAGAAIDDCASAQWRLQPSPDFPDPAGEPYPGYNGLYPFMHSHCGGIYDTAMIRGWVFYPTDAQWADGSRAFECWTGKR